MESSKPKPVLYNPYKNKSSRFRSSRVEITEEKRKAYPSQFITSQIQEMKMQKQAMTLKNTQKNVKRVGRLTSVSSGHILEGDDDDKKRTVAIHSHRSSSSGIVYDFRASSKDKSPRIRPKKTPNTPNVTAKKSKSKISNLFSSVFSRKSSKESKIQNKSQRLKKSKSRLKDSASDIRKSSNEIGFMHEKRKQNSLTKNYNFSQIQNHRRKERLSTPTDCYKPRNSSLLSALKKFKNKRNGGRKHIKNGRKVPSLVNAPVTSVLNSVRKQHPHRKRANFGNQNQIQKSLLDREVSLDLNKLAEEKFKELEKEEELNRQKRISHLDSNSLANSMILNLAGSPIKANIRPKLPESHFEKSLNASAGPSPMKPRLTFGKKAEITQLKVQGKQADSTHEVIDLKNRLMNGQGEEVQRKSSKLSLSN